MLIEFTKMHGIGNDFVVIDAVRQAVTLSADQIRRLADRHFGVGCDQVLLVERPTQPGVDFRYRILNADGSEVEQCGNGARCFARFVHDQGLTTNNPVVVETAGGIIRLRLRPDGQVEVNMGEPRFDPAQIPFVAEAEAERYTLDVAGETVTLGAVSMGNPHAVLQVPDVKRAPVERLGPLIERHARFPRRVNVGFMQVLSRDAIRLRVFERGAGETLACGSGACAAVAVGYRQGLLNEKVTVHLPGGSLEIQWPGRGALLMTGPAETVFEGKIDL